MPGPVEIIIPIVETALTLLPGLAEVPILGRILIALAPGGGNDQKALEELQKQADAKKTDRQTTIDRNARYVLKASEAMKCVETHLMNGGFLLALGKGLANAILGRSGGFAPDLLLNDIFACIESKTLRQDTPRVISAKRIYHRPARGHGKGRKKFG